MTTYRRDIDGLRALAVLAVLGFHAFPGYVPGGYIGVDVFFVISGFLITGIILDDLEIGRFSFRRFYTRRIRRIFPALIVVLIATLAIGWTVLFADEFYRLGWQLLASAGFASNFLFWHQAGYFDTASTTKPLLHLWSLAVEEQFYLLWPMVLVFFKGRIKIGTIITVAALASFASSIWLVGRYHDAAFYSPWSRFWELMIGAYLATINLNALPKRSSQFLSIAGACVILAAVFLYVRTSLFPGWIALLPTLGAAALIAAGPSSFVNRWLSCSPCVSIGLISYPLYLWHWPLLTFGRIISAGEPTNALLAATLAVSVMLAALTYLLVETPIKNWKLSPVPLVVAMIGLATFGLSTVLADGVPSRTANLYATLLDGARPSNHGKSDGSCERLVEHVSVSKEVCFTTSPAPDLLIVGDSHAMSLSAAARSSGKVMLGAGSSCLPFLHYEMHGMIEPPANRNCDKIAASALAAAAIPSIKTVVLAAMGPAYFADAGDYYIFKNGSKVADREAAFVDGYTDIIEKLSELRKRIVFVIDDPELGFSPETCLVRRLLLRARLCVLSRSDLDNRQERYRALIAEIKRRTGSLIVADATEQFCDSESCRWFDEGGSYYFDPNHLSPHGGALVMSAISRALGGP